MSLQSGAQLILQVERPDQAFDCLGFAGIPIVNPVFIALSCAETPQARVDLDDLRRELVDELRALSPGFYPVVLPCGGRVPDAASCHAHAENDCQKLLVLIGDDAQPLALKSSYQRWTVGFPNYHVLPVYRQSARTSVQNFLPVEFRSKNVEFWSHSIAESIPAILGLAGLTMENPRIFISYRQKDSAALAIQLFDALVSTPLMGMNLDRITTEELNSLALGGSPSYVNQALRTLRRLLGKAVEWKVIAVAPTVKLMKEVGCELTIDPETEARLLAVAKQPMKDIPIVIQDTGMRPDEVFRIRIENIDWGRRSIFNPSGKTKAARRHVPISERMLDLLMIRCSKKREGLFPSRRAECGHLTTVAKQFRDARSKAGLPKSLVLYCARHTFGTAAYGATGNLAMMMKVMGHTDPRTAMHYQHPLLDAVREAIDQRNLRHKPRHNELRVQ